MRSKTSLFKPVLIKTNLKQFWPVSLIYLIVLIFMLPVQLADLLKYNHDELGIMYSAVNVLDASQITVFPILAAAGAAFTCFFYLFSSKSSNMLHAFPLDRNKLFASNFVSGLILLAVPLVIAAIVSAPFIIKTGLGGRILPWLLTSFASCFIFYVIAVLSCILAGHTLAALVFYAFFNLAEGLVVILCRGFLSLTGFGLSGIPAIENMKQLVFSPAIFISGVFGLSADYSQETTEGFMRAVHYHGLVPLVIYAAVCVLIAVFALFLYKKRRLETVQEMSAFAFMRPLMRWIIAFGIGTTAALSLDISGRAHFGRFLVILIIFALLSFFAVEMVLRKSFRIFKKRTLAEAALCAVCISAVFITLRSDPLGITNRVPDADRLTAAGLYSNLLIVKDDKDGIEKIENLHRLILENKGELIQYNNGFSYGDVSLENIFFVYSQKDGSTVSRGYYIPVDMAEITGALNDLENDVSTITDYIFGVNSDDVKWESGNILEQSIDAKTADAVYQAYKEDLKDGNIKWQTGSIDYELLSDSCYMTLTGIVSPSLKTVEDKLPGIYRRYTGPYFLPASVWGLYGGSEREQVLAEFYVTSDCTHTAKVLKDAGIIKDAGDLNIRPSADGALMAG